MPLNLPDPGEKPWGDKLNAAIESVDTDLQSAKATFGSQVMAVNSDLQTTKTNLDSRLDTLETAGPPSGGGSSGGGGGGGESRFVSLVIMNGESNSAGFAPNSQALPEELAPQPQIQMLNINTLADWYPLNIPENNDGVDASTHGWELGLANSVAAGQWWDDTVYLIKTGQSGTAIGSWGPGSALWLRFLDRVRNGLALLRNAGKVPIIYFWYSLGINDAMGGTNEVAWKASMQEYFDRVRGEIGYVPIFMTKFMASSSPGGFDFNDTIDQLGVEDNMLIPIDATGTTTRDNHHWDYGGMKLMSDRMSAASKAFGQHENYVQRQFAMMAGGGTMAAPADKPALIRAPASVSFTEGSAGATFTVKLSSAPPSGVVVSVAASGGNVTPSVSTLTFTPGNWDTNQSVTLTSPNDGTASGNRSSTITLSSVGVSSSATVGVTVLDAAVVVGPTNTALPAITGSTAVGGVLTCSQGTWTGSPTSYAYQWKRGAISISGGTANTHTVLAGDVGYTLSCTVTATNVDGSSTASSTGTNIVDTGSLVAFSWQNLTNATEDGSHALVMTAASAGGGNATTPIDASAPFEVIIDWDSGALVNGMVVMLDNAQETNFAWGSQDFTTGVYIYSGAGFVGINGTASIPLGWTPTFPSKIKMEKSGNNVIYSSSTDNGSTWTPRYTHTGVLAGKTTQFIRVVSAEPAVGRKVTVYYDSDLGAGPTAPSNSTLPAITGSSTVGGVLTCSTGSWLGSPTTYAYQWKRDGSVISSETANAYTVLVGDIGHALSCTVTASNVTGSASATAAGVPISATMTPVTWDQGMVGTDSPSAGVIHNTTNTQPIGGRVAETIDLAAPFDIEVVFAAAASTEGIAIYVDEDTTTNYGWDASNQYLFGGFHYGGSWSFTLAGGSYDATSSKVLTFPCRIKMTKVGDDVVFSSASGLSGGAYGAPFFTKVGALAGKTTGYIKALWATPAADQSVTVKRS